MNFEQVCKYDMYAKCDDVAYVLHHIVFQHYADDFNKHMVLIAII